MKATPSTNLVANLRDELQRWLPFAQMSAEQVERFVLASVQQYFAPGERIVVPDDGTVGELRLVRRGSVSGQPRDAGAAFRIEAGEFFPLGAALAARAVTSTYTAAADTFCLQVPVGVVQVLSRESPALADFLNRRVQHLLDLSRQALQAAFASQSLAEQTMQTPLRELLRGAAPAVPPQTPLADALRLMRDRDLGALLVQAEGEAAAQGILTRHDILERVTLAALPLATPIREVMSAPVASLTAEHSAQDAVLAMSRRGIHHLAVTDAAGRCIGLVSEHDLFALQSLSLRQLGTALRGAPDTAALRALAGEIRRFARKLLAQGVGARQLTELISHLNDLLTGRLVALVAARRGVDLARGCWLAFGSEGRGEQTIATDQDNGIAFASDDAEAERPAWLALAHDVNAELDACGYPLCRGNIMASNPDCCLTQAEWLARFDAWIAHGAPQDLLHASIYFDLRAVAGNATLAQPLRELISTRAAQVPRFIKQMADNALRTPAALDWLGGIATHEVGGRTVLDLKLEGTAICVDVARLYALAHGCAETGTRRRFEVVAQILNIPPHESQAWVDAFEFLQRLRLQAQLESSDAPNLVEPDSLNDIDRRMLKECLRMTRQMQQRVELDYRR